MSKKTQKKNSIGAFFPQFWIFPKFPENSGSHLTLSIQLLASTILSVRILDYARSTLSFF